MKKKPSPSAVNKKKFYLRASGNQVFQLEYHKRLQTVAFEWAYRVRNRSLWASSENSRMDIAEQARKDLRSLGLGDHDLTRLANEPVIEVNIPYEKEALGWELRILPWEFFLSTAIGLQGQKLRPLIVRRLQRDEGHHYEPVSRTLLVVSSPSVIGDYYEFDHEQRLLATALEITPGTDKFQVLKTPTPETLQACIQDFKPHLIHLTGVDSHEGAELLGLPKDRHRKDGFYLSDNGGKPLVLEYEELASILHAAVIKPTLVTSNTYHSAPRTCAMAVAAGAQLGLGFQDEIDNTLAEQFLAAFYRAWKVSGFQALDAFQVAFDKVSQHPNRMYGGGVVLWSVNSLLEETRPSRDEEYDRVKESLDNESRAPYSTGIGDLREQVDVDPIPNNRLNYTLLHNNQNLFASFVLRKYTLSTIREIDIDVTLQIGSDQFRYRSMFDLEDQSIDIADRIRVPLTWEYARTLKETVLTSLYINVTHRGDNIYRDTLQVRLLPPDEWLDTQHDGMWLPSFVLPRDPVVRQIVNKAQNYLKAINDDPEAGFDGYQSGDPAIVDFEVQAIWSAIVYDYNLSYIDPPPTYSESSQRLRTPEDTISGNCGTCIDLALLFASCLEYIGLYPLIFLLKGHAFPGYWRHFSDHSRFFELKNRLPVSDETVSAATIQLAENGSWMITEEGFDLILSSLIEEEFVPVETVSLTAHESFFRACEEATRTLGKRQYFDAMLDIKKARDNKVTPLPLRGAME